MICEDDIRIQMAELGTSLFQRGYAVGGAGNLSARLPDGNILVTPTNASLGRLVPERLSRVSPAGEHLDGDRPTKESSFHLMFYRRNPQCGAVSHLHSTCLTALSCLKGLNPDNVIEAFTPYYVMKVGQLMLIPYFRPGSPRIGEEMEKRVDRTNAFLLANHGSVVVGKSLEEAINNSEELEETAKLWFMLHDMRYRKLTAGEVDELL
jgi:Ribulose-5-phosphate 4-epimerase and related epimerases and aldolases